MPPILRRIFWVINTFFMVPMFRLGFGPLFGNPFSGYIMVLKAVGRKSGKIRFAPVNYAIYKGDIYCISGGRQNSDWFRNLLATPRIDVIMPAGSIFASVEQVTDADERLIITRQVLKNAGFAGFFEGYNPFTISDAALAPKIADLPVLRLHPLGIGSGASDPGGWVWGWVLLGMLAVIWLLVK
jgi:deazaflavin-dependent oxidoreductase (nitroreductase family)